MQAPEGFYYIDRFNPQSQFHLSLGLNYPNSSDRKLGDRENPGKDIFIHGNHVSAGCFAMTDPVIGNHVSAGCFAMTDPVIDITYGMATHAREKGQRTIPVSIFPYRMTPANWASFRRQYAQRPDLIQFWSSLQPA